MAVLLDGGAMSDTDQPEQQMHASNGVSTQFGARSRGTIFEGRDTLGKGRGMTLQQFESHIKRGDKKPQPGPG